MKKAFTEGGIQAFPDFGVEDPFILTTDLSKVSGPGQTTEIPWMLGKKV